jgi:hypothetical protein
MNAAQAQKTCGKALRREHHNCIAIDRACTAWLLKNDPKYAAHRAEAIERNEKSQKERNSRK